MFNVLLRQYWLLWVASGLFFSIPFLQQNLWPFLILAFISLLFAVRVTTSLWKVFVGSLFVGTCKSAAGISWYWYTYPLDWLNFPPGIGQLLLIGASWSSTAIALGVGVALTTVITKYVWTWYGRKALFVFPILWVCGESVGSLLFALGSYGPGAFANTYFSFGYTGYPISHIAILYPIVVLGGVYALSLLATTFGVVSYLVVSYPQPKRGHFLKLGLGMLVILFLIYIITPERSLSSNGIRVIVIDTEFTSVFMQSTEGVRSKKRAVVSAVLTATQYAPDIVLLPEDSRFTRVFKTPEATLLFLQEKIGTSTTIVVDSSRFIDAQGRTVLRAFYYDLGNNAIYETDKQYLVPQGEYVSYLIAGLMNIAGYDEMLEILQKKQSYIPGSKKGYTDFPADVPGILFCFEGASPLGVPTITQERTSPVVFYVASHAWFHEPNILWSQLDEMLRIQAIWNNKTIVQAGNMVAGKVYFPNGSIARGTERMSSKYWKIIEYDL